MTFIGVQDNKGDTSGCQFLSGDTVFFLDLFRVIACELVLLGHLLPLYKGYNSSLLYNQFFNLLIDYAGHLSFIGVALFFYISGVVISNSLFKKNVDSGYNFINYFIDRFSRIYAGLVPCLIIILLVGYILYLVNPTFYSSATNFDSYFISFGVIIGNLLMLQEIPPLFINTPPLGGMLWTLNIEWWLYMMFGWVILEAKKILRFDPKTIIILLAMSIYPMYKFLVSEHNFVTLWFFGMLFTLLLININKINIYVIKLLRSTLGYVLIGCIFLLFILRMISNHIGGSSASYDFTLEILIGLFIITTILKFNDIIVIQSKKIKNTIGIMAKYSFTLYLVHMVFIYLIFGLTFAYEINMPLIIHLFLTIIIVNVLALVIALPTEMRYKKLSRLLNSKLQLINTWRTNNWVNVKKFFN